MRKILLISVVFICSCVSPYKTQLEKYNKLAKPTLIFYIENDDKAQESDKEIFYQLFKDTELLLRGK